MRVGCYTRLGGVGRRARALGDGGAVHGAVRLLVAVPAEGGGALAGNVERRTGDVLRRAALHRVRAARRRAPLHLHPTSLPPRKTRQRPSTAVGGSENLSLNRCRRLVLAEDVTNRS